LNEPIHSNRPGPPKRIPADAAQRPPHHAVFSETLKLAMDSFRASKMRFALTALGMVIGTASVILVITIGLTGKEFILQELQKIETNAIELEYSGGGATAPSACSTTTRSPATTRKPSSPSCPASCTPRPSLMHDRISFGGGVTKDTLVLGVSPQYQQIRNLLVPVGRFFDDEDDSAHIKCAVVSEHFARDRFGSDDAAVGQTFEISRIPSPSSASSKRPWMTSATPKSKTRPSSFPDSVARYFTGRRTCSRFTFPCAI
jgi:putative ABC transport system permease protein